jgi:hypothetical protein
VKAGHQEMTAAPTAATARARSLGSTRRQLSGCSPDGSWADNARSFLLDISLATRPGQTLGPGGLITSFNGCDRPPVQPRVEARIHDDVTAATL